MGGGEVGSLVRGRAWHRGNAFTGQARRRRERNVADRAPIVVGQVIRGAMGMATKARRWRGPLHRHAWAPGDTVTRGAGATGRIHFATMRYVGKAQESRCTLRPTPRNDARIGAVVTRSAGFLVRHRRGFAASGYAGVAAFAQRKQPFVALVREGRRRASLGASRRGDHRQHDERLERSLHGGPPAPPAPGSRPTVHSRRTENLRWLQSGDDAPPLSRCT